MSFFGVRYWRFMFWLNVVLAVVHAVRGHNHVFLALGLVLLSKVMMHLLQDTTTEN